MGFGVVSGDLGGQKAFAQIATLNAPFLNGLLFSIGFSRGKTAL